jgi:hypothetical protein
LIITGIGLRRLGEFALDNIDAEDLKESVELSDEDVADQLDNAMFFPLTWATKQPRTYYAGTDPEWQEFIRIAKDKETRNKIKTDAMKLVSEGATRHPVISSWLGKDTRFGRAWLEFHFPDGPPEEYLRGGVFWATDFVGTGAQVMTTEEYQQWMRSIWPVAAGRSAWAAVKVLVGMQIRRLQQVTGYAKANPSSPEEIYKKWRALLHFREQEATGSTAKGQAGKSQTTAEGEPGSVDTSSSIVSNNSSAISSRASEFPLTDRKLPSWLVSDPSKAFGSSSDSTTTSVSTLDPSDPSANSFSNLDLPVAMLIFNQTFRQITAPKMRDYRDIPRGHFIVHGLVEMMGSNGRVQFDIISAYDPEEKKFINASIKVRGHYPKLQAPKGGPGTLP